MASIRTGAIPAREDRYEHGVLQACGTLQSAVTGSGEYTYDHTDKLADWLRYRVRSWEPSGIKSGVEYDSLVYALATRALVDYEAWRRGTRGGS